MATRLPTPDILGDILNGKPTAPAWPQEVDYPLNRIVIGKRLRDVGDVTELANSMAAQGLLQRIVLRPDGTLVVGGHRVAAAKLLEWRTIPARIVEMDDVDAELAEIDENLYRRELTVLEQAEHLHRRMQLLEIKGQRAKAGDNQHSDVATTAAVAESMGISERSAQQRLQIARGLTQEARDAIRGTDLASSTTKLLELTRQPQQYQAAIVEKLLSGYGEVRIAAMAAIPHIVSIETYFDRSGYYARVSGPNMTGMAATAVCADEDAVRSAFEAGEYSPDLHHSHLTRSYLAHYGGSDTLFDQTLRDAAEADILAAWQWRTTTGDKARTACNKMASKLRRLGHEAADIEAGSTIYWSPTNAGQSADGGTVDAGRGKTKAERAANMTPLVVEYARNYCDRYGRTVRLLDPHSAAHTNSTFWTDITKEWRLRKIEYEEDVLKTAIKAAFEQLHAENGTGDNHDNGANVVPSDAAHSRQQGAELAKCSVCNRPLSDPASAIAGVGPCCAAKRAAAAAAGSQAEDDDRTDDPEVETIERMWNTRTATGVLQNMVEYWSTAQRMQLEWKREGTGITLQLRMQMPDGGWIGWNGKNLDEAVRKADLSL